LTRSNACDRSICSSNVRHGGLFWLKPEEIAEFNSRSAEVVE